MNHKISKLLTNGSLILYLVWILLPSATALGHSYPGVLSIFLFLIGVVLDKSTFKAHWRLFLLQGFGILVLSLANVLFLRHGGDNKRAQFIQAVQFFFPMMAASYFRLDQCRKLFPGIKKLLFLLVILTSLTTLAWNGYGMLSPDEKSMVSAYSRIVAGGYTTVEERYALQLRNIGGMYFIYGLSASIPFLCCGIQHTKGRKRLALSGVLVLFLLTVATAQFTFATLFAVFVLALEAAAGLVRLISKGRINRWLSLGIGFFPMVLVLFFLTPLVDGAYSFACEHGLTFIRNSLQALGEVTDGGIGSFWQSVKDAFGSIRANPPSGIENDGAGWNDVGRLNLYLYSILGFTKSPLIGSLFSTTHWIGYHSDILDSLSGCGLAGTALLGAALWLVGKGTLKPTMGKKTDIHVFLVLTECFLMALLNPVVCGRELTAMLMAGMLFLPQEEGEGEMAEPSLPPAFRFTRGQRLYLPVKRTLDLLFSSVGCLVLLPLAALIRVILWTKGDTSPIFFRQVRVGKDGKIFRLWKFRTMVPNAQQELELLLVNPVYQAQWEANQKLDQDPRITSFGHLLRLTSLDELPQLINVLQGDMSLVGPRPLVQGELENHNGRAIYHQIKPGMTGWWACNGRSNIDYQDRLEMEYDYIAHFSPVMDLKCILRTIAAVLKGRGAK